MNEITEKRQDGSVVVETLSHVRGEMTCREVIYKAWQVADAAEPRECPATIADVLVHEHVPIRVLRKGHRVV